MNDFGAKFEFSGPRTPQRNGKVERKFQIFYGRFRSMFNGAGLNGAVTRKDKTQGKLRNCRSTCMFVGYIENHPRDVCRKLMLKTHGVINYRDFLAE
jgi:hypothetical protein